MTQRHVIVIGAGNAGMPAAIEAADAGARVTLLEKTDRLGGALWFSSHSISGAGTRMQREKGIQDSPQSHYDDIWRIGRQRSDPAILRVAVEQSGPGIDWLESIGVEFTPESPIITWGHEPYSAPRTYNPVPMTDQAGVPIQGSGPGRTVMAALERELRRRDAITIRFRARVTQLLKENGVVCGVRLQNGGEIRGDAVILATGGYSSSPELLRKYHPQYDHLVYLTPPHATGDGLALAEEAGGTLTNMDLLVILTGGVEDQRSPGLCVYWVTATTLRSPGLTGDIWLNRHGERFMAEDERHPDVRERAVMAQPSTEVYILMDDPMRWGLTPEAIPDRVRTRLEGHSPDFHVTAPTLAELAVRVGLPPEKVEASVARYNAMVAAGKDTDFGRQSMPKALDTPPYHCIPTTGCVILSQGGVKVDPRARVLDAAGQPVPGLYAAGEVMGAGQIMGDCFAGGQGVGGALVFGRIAGQEAARAD